MARPLVLLGPQRHQPTLRAAVHDVLGPPDGAPRTFGVVTAGWEEREGELEEMREHLGENLFNLSLFERAEEVFQRDRAVLVAMRERDQRLRHMQDLYRLRLSHAMEAVRELSRRLFDSGGAHEDLVEDEFVASIEAVRELDAQHLERLRQVHLEFDEELRPLERPSIQRHREELAHELGQAAGLCVAGGHVVILLNRLRLFDPIGLVGDVPIFAWSAGAMVLGPRVVVFHDSPPQGPGNAEVLEAGLGLYEELVPLPHASERLRLDDPLRVSVFARRFAPDACVTLDPLAGLVRRGGAWDALPATSRLNHDGRLVPAGGTR